MHPILNHSRQLWYALSEANYTTLESMIKDNARFVHMGATLTKEQELETVRQKRIIYHDIQFEDHQITEYHDMTLLFNTLTLTAIVNDQTVTNRFVVTEVYHTYESRSKLASMSFTKILY